MTVEIDNLNWSAYQYHLAVQDKFNEICEPLFNLGIKYFYYSIYFKTGEHLQFSNHTEFIRDHYFYLRRVGNIMSEIYSETFSKDQVKNYFLVPHDKRDQDEVIDLMVCRNIGNGFVILKKDSEYIKTYAFATDRNDLYLCSQFYFNNLCLLEHFCDYFDDRAKSTLDCTNKTKFGFLELPEPFPKIYQEDVLSQKIQDFLQETFIAKRILKTREKDIHLSKRELECLDFLSLGKTMKEIARCLDLSPRSVEFYLQNIKKKTGLKRGELISYYAHNLIIDH